MPAGAKKARIHGQQGSQTVQCRICQSDVQMRAIYENGKMRHTAYCPTCKIYKRKPRFFK